MMSSIKYIENLMTWIKMIQLVDFLFRSSMQEVNVQVAVRVCIFTYKTIWGFIGYKLFLLPDSIFE